MMIVMTGMPLQRTKRRRAARYAAPDNRRLGKF
jgi:hypothetical protein